MEDKPIFRNEQEELLKSIELEAFQDDPNAIKKIIFVTTTKVVTWKPKINKITKIYGMPMTLKVPMSVDNIPEKLKELSHLVNTNGPTAILMNYFVTEFQGETYYFISSEKTFNDWSISYEKMESGIEVEGI